MNEVVKSAGGALAGLKGLKQNLAKVKAAIPVSSGTAYLRFLTDGSWVFGQENKELDAYDAKKERSDRNFGDEIAFNPLDIKVGLTCWTDYPKDMKKKNEKMGEALVPLGADVPLKHEMPDKGPYAEWKEIVVLSGRIVSGRHEGAEVQYSASSQGGMRMAQSIIDQIMVQLDESDDLIVPVVELGKDWYDHQSYGKTWVPTYTLVEFIGMDGAAPAKPEAAEKLPAPEPEPEEEPAAEEPVRRRRR